MTVHEWRNLIRASRLSPSARLVAFVLSLRMNGDTLECWPAVATIAKETGTSDRTVRRALSELRASGYLWIRYRAKFHRSSVYRATRPKWLPAMGDGRDDPWRQKFL